MKIISIKPHLKLSLFSFDCVHVLRNNRHPAYSDPGMKSKAPDASATGVNPQASQFISPRLLT